MPFAPHLRITALGRLGTGSGERFSYGLNMAQNDNAGPFELEANQAVWTDLAADIRSFHISAQTGISPLAVLEEVKFASIGADGKYTTDPVIVNIADTGGNGPASTQTIPQAAMAVSLMTARRGATGRGRFYIPMPTFPVDPLTLQVAALDVAGLRDRAVTLVNNLNNQPGIDVLGLRVVVSSTKGYNSDVTAVRVGRVVDTIRSRRTSLPEAYSASVAVAAP